MHTSNSHAIAPIQWVPQHRTVCNWDQSFGELFRVRGKGVERDTRPAQDESLEARRGHMDRMRHGDCSSSWTSGIVVTAGEGNERDELLTERCLLDQGNISPAQPQEALY